LKAARGEAARSGGDDPEDSSDGAEAMSTHGPIFADLVVRVTSCALP
jgi:hypothetical protein